MESHGFTVVYCMKIALFLSSVKCFRSKRETIKYETMRWPMSYVEEVADYAVFSAEIEGLRCSRKWRKYSREDGFRPIKFYLWHRIVHETTGGLVDKISIFIFTARVHARRF